MTESSTLKFAIFNDTHIGFQETDSICGNDSFKVFKEALSIAEFEKVDAVLHAGDLFDVRSPSTHTQIKTTKILWKRCIGMPKEDQISIPCFDGLSQSPNTNNEDLNVTLPFFVIHGNHDAPSGQDLTTPCELLSTARVLNYFKRSNSVQEIELEPVVLRRKNLDVVLYGLGFVSQRSFIDCLGSKPIKFKKPQNLILSKNTFTIFLLHQDRVARGKKMENLQEMFLGKYPDIDLVIWGHEHEHIEFDLEKSRVMQLGSTICTQLTKKYATNHYMMIFEVSLISNFYCNDLVEDAKLVEETIQTHYHELPLQNSRPLLFKTLALHNEFGRTKEFFMEQIKDTITQMLSENEFEKPFIRLCILSSPELYDPHNLNLHKIEYEFSSQVANSKSILKIKKTATSASKNKKLNENQEHNKSEFDLDKIDHVDFEDMIDEHMDSVNFDFLTREVFKQSLSAFVSHDMKDAFIKNIGQLFKKRVEFLIERVTEKAPCNHRMTDCEWLDLFETNKKYLPDIECNSSRNHSSCESPKKKSMNSKGSGSGTGEEEEEESKGSPYKDAEQVDDLFQENRVKKRKNVRKPKKHPINALTLSLVEQ